jgi:maltose acetyltransferase-like protein
LNELYDPFEPERARARSRANRLLARSNRSADDERNYRASLLRGDRAVVGAGSVVTGDVAADAVVAGNPSRPLAPHRLEVRR